MTVFCDSHLFLYFFWWSFSFCQGDFGLTRITTTSLIPKLRPGGTKLYMSPEQHRSDFNITTQSDVCETQHLYAYVDPVYHAGKHSQHLNVFSQPNFVVDTDSTDSCARNASVVVSVYQDRAISRRFSVHMFVDWSVETRATARCLAGFLVCDCPERVGDTSTAMARNAQHTRHAACSVDQETDP